RTSWTRSGCARTPGSSTCTTTSESVGGLTAVTGVRPPPASMRAPVPPGSRSALLVGGPGGAQPAVVGAELRVLVRGERAADGAHQQPVELLAADVVHHRLVQVRQVLG